MRKAAVLAIVALGLLVSACNTIAGAGRDVEAVGDAVASTAEDAKR